MALNTTNLFPSFAGSGGLVKTWSYTTTDTLATVLSPGYFNNESSALGVGDVIQVSIVDAVSPASRTSLTEAVPVTVVKNTSGVVTVRLWGDYTSRNVVTHFDDFEGAVIVGTWAHPTKGSDGATVDFAVSADVNGKLQGTTGAGAGGSMAANGIKLYSALNWKANQGAVVFEARVKISAITNISAFVGLTDGTTLQAPIIGSGTADGLTNNATDAVGFLFDTTMTTKHLWLVGVANTTGATAQDSALAYVADTYRVFRIELSAAGVASFYIDNSLIGTAMTGAVTATVALTPTVTAFTRTAASATVAIDYIGVTAYRV